jgi:signal transduction histidine kinase
LPAQLLLRHLEVGTRGRASVLRIRDEARSLLRLVLNLLDISKSEEGQLAPRHTDVDLDALFTEILEAHEVKAQDTGVVLGRAVEVRSIAADADLLRRSSNLPDNAIDIHRRKRARTRPRSARMPSRSASLRPRHRLRCAR